MSELTKKPRGVYLTGSLSLPDTETVFKTVSTEMPHRVKRIPDGETDTRSFYLLNIIAMLRDAEGMMLGAPPPDMPSGVPALALKAGVTAKDVRFKSFGLAEAAIESFAVFDRLRKQGTIDADAKFLVCLLSPMEILSTALRFDFYGFEEEVDSVIKREIEQICAAIPHDRLAIQLDVISGVYEIDRIQSGAPRRSTFLVMDREEVLNRYVRYSNWIPDDVELGYHFCFGDADMEPDNVNKGRKALGLNDEAETERSAAIGGGVSTEESLRTSNRMLDFQPQTAASMVEIASELTRRLRRPYNFAHMPFPMHRSSAEFVAPLKNLEYPPGADLYLGVVNWRDGVEGAQERIALAQDVIPTFGISTCCGMGRIGGGPERQQHLFEILRELTDEI
jgi:hypothetical protein